MWAWGGKGHTIVNELAARGLAGRVPAFVTAPVAQFEITYLGPQEDRLKGSGFAWDGDYDPGHFIDLLDDTTIAGVVSLAHLPANREAYDTALRGAGTDQYRQGYLPYSILEGWEQLRQDFAYWRADDHAARRDASAAVRAHEVAVRAVDERLILQDMGVWGHFVGDACQPLHVTVHFNGWGAYPNPKGYTNSRRTHSFFESTFVNRYITLDDVARAVPSQSRYAPPQQLLTQPQVLADVAAYLRETLATVRKLYEIEKSGGFAGGSAQARAFTASRLAAGAAELRDLTVLAWQDSIHARVGYPGASVQQILQGNAPWPSGD